MRPAYSTVPPRLFLNPTGSAPSGVNARTPGFFIGNTRVNPQVPINETLHRSPFYCWQRATTHSISRPPESQR